MKIKVNALLSISSILIGFSLISSSVFASYLITDDADQIGARIGLTDTVLVQFMNADMTSVNKSEFVNSGDKLSTSTIPTDPSLEGYVFDGWTTDSLNFTKTTDNFSTKTYTTNVTYYPRFASYGYKVGSSDAAHLANKWDINNNTSIAHGASLTLGTYIYGKTSLENATSAVTIPNAGGYALVCDAHEAAWNASKAGNIDNWHIERYIAVIKTSDWGNNKLFARINDDTTHEDRFLSNISGNDYYVYTKYNATSINFGSVSNETETVPENLSQTIMYLDAITLNDTTSYTLEGNNAYYLTGSFGSANWGINNSYALTSETSNKYTISALELNAGDKLKVISNTHTWYSNATDWTNCGFTLDGDKNVVVDSTGLYNIDFYVVSNENNHIVPNIYAKKSTFTVNNVELSSGESVKAVIYEDSVNWVIKEELTLAPVQGQTNQYSATSSNYLLMSGHPFKYVIDKTSGDDDWDTLNPSGNRTVYGGTDESYTYVAPEASIECYIRGTATNNNDWDPHDEYGLIASSEDGIKYEVNNVHLKAGNFKVADNNWGPINLGSADLAASYDGFGSSGDNISCSFPGYYNIKVNNNNKVVIELVSYDEIQFTFPHNNQSWAYNGVKIFISYQTGDNWTWKQVDSFASGASSVTVTLPSNTIKALLVRCPTSTTTPNWGITSGDAAGRIYNKTADIDISPSTTSYTVTFVDYP